MLSKVKIDKLRLIYKKKDVPQETREEIDNILRTHYPDYSLFNKAGLVLSTFTPTKQKRHGMPELKHNLQMPSLKQFQEPLTHLHPKMWFSIIHLAKDILLTNPVNDYLLMLAERSYSRIEPELIESEGIYSLYFKYSHNDDSLNGINFVIKFYNKAEEYYKQHKTYICPLYEQLTQNEIKQLGKAYDSDTHSLNLRDLNMLRVEIELQGADKLSPLTNLLSHKDKERFTVELLLNVINKGTLNTDLEQIFTTILQRTIFNAKETLETATAEVSKIRKLACELLLDSSDFYGYQNVANELGLQNQFSEIRTIIRKVTPNSDLYKELCNKLFFKGDKSALKNRFIRTCKPHSSPNLKDFILIYVVPILDDS